MFVNKNFTPKQILQFSGKYFLYTFIWAFIVTITYELTHWDWMSIPWLPLSVIGTAVAFYIGFKNNQAYDRLWEARKIWGGIINSSRAWGSISRSYISNQFTNTDISEDELKQTSKTLIYRHLAWLYMLREQLLIPTPWEHISQGKHVKRQAIKTRDRFGLHLLDDDLTLKHISKFLTPEEKEDLKTYKNKATRLIDSNALHLKELREKNIIDDFRHMEMQNILNEFYDLQGKCERIKKFPLPRQYGFMSLVFVFLFVFLLPFGMVSEFHKLGDSAVWLCVPFSALVGWVFMVMESVGDYSENPFEGGGTDIPMFSLCRTIEIDLRQMIGDADIPKPVEAINGVLL